jgi:hypothetical protein
VTGMRPPVVGGAGGGVGTTMLALALCGRDGGIPGVADVLVCRATVESLGRAADVLERAGPGPRPVLAVTLDGARLPRGPVRARLRTLEPQASAVVLLPHVRTWRTADAPSAQAATLLVEPVERVPGPLRAYATAVHDVAAAVVASGRLQTASPPPDSAGAPGDRALSPPDSAVAPGRRAPSRPDPAVAPGHRLPAFGAGPPRTARGTAVVPRVVGTGRPVAAPRAAAPQRGVRILTRATPPVPVRPVAPVRTDPGRQVPAGGSPRPAEQAG